MTRKLMPIGGGYATLDEFARAASANARDEWVRILVLPISYASDPFSISSAEREQNLARARARCRQIEEACARVWSAKSSRQGAVVLAPILTRADALRSANHDLFTDDLAAIFILGGDQTVAMRAIMDTPLEVLLHQAYQRGVIIAGTSAGCAVQTRIMLGGYAPDFSATSSFDRGAVDVWNSETKHGLPFGVTHAIFDQHFFQRGRWGRLLHAIGLPNMPPVGVGVDAFTGVYVRDETQLHNAFGAYGIAVLDAATYRAAEHRAASQSLSLRNVLVHLLAPGDFTYDLVRRRHSLAAPLAEISRTFKALALPANAGALLLAGDLRETIDLQQPVRERFVELAGGERAHLAIVVMGYESQAIADSVAQQYTQAFNVPAQIFVPMPGEPFELPPRVTGIVLVAQDQAQLDVTALDSIARAWRGGVPLLADNAAAAIVGAYYAAHAPTPNLSAQAEHDLSPSEAEKIEDAAQKSFLRSNTHIVPGLGLLNAMVEARVLSDNRWGRMFALAYEHPDRLSIGLTQNTALEITHAGARVVGVNSIVVLDLRTAQLARGTNDGLVIANGLLDVLAPGAVVSSALDGMCQADL